MPLTPGTRLGRYEVIRLLGAGGMGEVYLAKDERLEREVALKVLPTGTLADESARKRFRREALALSKLTHPNIAVVYDFDTHEGVDFLAMEYVAGQTLAEKLGDGALPEKEVATLGGQIASALEEAHDQGVVHRDLKPGNIIVTLKGQTKLLDFGLARLLEPVAEGSQVQTISQPGSTAGTMPYMAPEQLRAEKVDARTDIFALGAVLYEMATGQRTFKGDSSPQVTDAILHQATVTPRALNPQVSPDMERIVLKCLEKDAADRYQSAKEVGVDLRRLTRTTSGPVDVPVPTPGIGMRRHLLNAAISVAALLILLVVLNVGGLRDRLLGGDGPSRIESLAVLPLENLSGDPEQEFFADGMTDALITDLSKISALKVISRTSSMRYPSEGRPPLPEIAQQLGVDAVIEGSVLRVGDRVRITAQLIEAATDQHLWAESYERELSDVLRLQGEVAQAIAREIRIQLTPEEKTRLSQAQQVDAEVYRLYLQGRHELKLFNQDSLQRAIVKFEDAIEIDRSFALAYAGLADAYGSLGYIGFADFPASQERLTKAKALAIKALELDEGLSEAHTSLGMLKQRLDLDFSGAETEHLQALSLSPGSAMAHEAYSTLLSVTGRHDQALATAREAQRLDPISFRANMLVAQALTLARRYDEAIREIENIEDIFPDQGAGNWWLGFCLIGKGRYSEAVEVFERNAGRSQIVDAALGHAYGLAGRYEEAEAILARLKASHRQNEVSPYYIAWVCVGLGRKTEALDWLDLAYEKRWGHLAFLKTNPVWDALHSDPRYVELVRKIGLED